MKVEVDLDTILQFGEITRAAQNVVERFDNPLGNSEINKYLEPSINRLRTALEIYEQSGG